VKLFFTASQLAAGEKKYYGCCLTLDMGQTPLSHPQEYFGSKKRVGNGTAALNKKEAYGKRDELGCVVARVNKLGEQDCEHKHGFRVGHACGETQRKLPG
jgi:hypothetical protein